MTVPGDVLAGGLWAVSSGGDPRALVTAGVAAVLFYCFGLLLNDWADVEVDRRERPGRPLPSGVVSPGQALTVAGVCATLGLAGLAWATSPAALGMGMGLVGLIVLYNFAAKRHPVTGALTMGACRAGSLLLGAFAVQVEGGAPPVSVFSLAMGLGIYIAAVTLVARQEMAGRPSAALVGLPTVALGLLILIVLPVLWGSANLTRFFAILVLVLAVSMMTGSSVRDPLPPRFRKGWMGWLPTSVPEGIGLWISLLLPLQAGWVIATDREPWNVFFGFLLLIAFPVNRWLARKIAMS
ncbi:MAG TPA: UbiA family prenyltransferase [Kiritimatiellia bacterium]|nr:UbiA family prenyltransferase [Kiritimatiellia bacterium]